MTIIAQAESVERQPQLLRALVDLRDIQIQKARIQFSNRVAAGGAEGTDTQSQVQSIVVKRYQDMFQQIEDDITNDIAVLVQAYPIYDHVSALKGIGPTLAAKLIALVGDISTFTNVSKLWRFSGYATIADPKWQPPVHTPRIEDDSDLCTLCGRPEDEHVDSVPAALRDGESFIDYGHDANFNAPRIAERAVKGEKLHYNKRLKVALYLVATSFMRSRSPYRAVYDAAREKYDRTRPEWTPLHKHRAALRIMVKVFLTHFWRRWRTLEGLPCRNLYVEEYLGHETIYKEADFGWPTI